MINGLIDNENSYIVYTIFIFFVLLQILVSILYVAVLHIVT